MAASRHEAPHRIVECIADLHAVYGGDRQIVLAREVTKLFETIHACKLSEAQTWLESDANQQRGEFVVLISAAIASVGLSTDTLATLTLLLAELPLKQAVQLAAKITGANRSELYQLALEMKKAE